MADYPENIYHEGIVDRVEQNTIYVRIIAQSACSACHAKGMCTALDVKEKLIEVDRSGFPSFQAGDHVILKMKRSMGNKAVVLAYGIPFILLITTLLIATEFLGDLTAGLLSLGILLPYYLLLMAFRKKIFNAFKFSIQSRPENFSFTCHT